MAPPAHYDPDDIAIIKPDCEGGFEGLRHYKGPQIFTIPGNHVNKLQSKFHRVLILYLPDHQLFCIGTHIIPLFLPVLILALFQRPGLVRWPPNLFALHLCSIMARRLAYSAKQELVCATPAASNLGFCIRQRPL